jgi:hypothetical protein
LPYFLALSPLRVRALAAFGNQRSRMLTNFFQFEVEISRRLAYNHWPELKKLSLPVELAGLCSTSR